MSEKLTLDELLDQFKAMTLVELQAFVTRFEETFGVSAAFIVPSDAMRGRVEVEPEVEEPTEFDVVLVEVDQRFRIATIKQIRAVTSLGLKEAKDVADRVPATVLRGLAREAAEHAAAALRAGGALVEVRPSDGGPTAMAVV